MSRPPSSDAVRTPLQQENKKALHMEVSSILKAIQNLLLREGAAPTKQDFKEQYKQLNRLLDKVTEHSRSRPKPREDAEWNVKRQKLQESRERLTKLLGPGSKRG